MIISCLPTTPQLELLGSSFYPWRSGMWQWWALARSFSDPCISVLLCAWRSWVWSFLRQFLQTLALLPLGCLSGSAGQGDTQEFNPLCVWMCSLMPLWKSRPVRALPCRWFPRVHDYVRICLSRWLRLKFSPLCLVDHCSSIYSLSSKVSSWCVVHLHVKQFLVVVYFIGGKRRYKCYGQSVMFNQEFTICHHTCVYVSKDCSTTERLCLFIHPLYP